VETPPETMTDTEMQRHFEGGPSVSKSAVLALVGNRLYKRDDGCWRLLDNKPQRRERADGS
jgi:hypothetical protein